MTRTSLTAMVGAVCAATASVVAHADSEWASRSELGYALARGNTDSDNGNLKFDIAHLYNHWIEAFGMDALYGKTNGIGTAQRWDVDTSRSTTSSPRRRSGSESSNIRTIATVGSSTRPARRPVSGGFSCNPTLTS